MASASLAVCGCWDDPEGPGRPFRRGVRVLGDDPARPGRPLPPWLRVLGTGGVPVYGGIVYCQHAILEYGFIDQ